MGVWVCVGVCVGVRVGVCGGVWVCVGELKTAVNLDEGNVVHLGESVNKLGVLGVFAVGSEDAKHGLLAVNALAHFVKALNDTSMDLGLLNHTLDSIGEVINFLLLDDSDFSD